MEYNDVYDAERNLTDGFTAAAPGGSRASTA